VRWGHTVTVLTCAPNFPEGRVYPGFRNRWCQTEEMSGIQVIRLKTFMAPNAGALLRILDFLSFMLVAFVAGLFGRRPDVVVATSPQFFAAVAGWALAAVRRRPFVFELSDLWPASIVAVGAMRPGRMVRWMERVELFLYRKAAAVVALTGSFKRDLVARGVPAEKIAVVLNGVELSRYAPCERDAALAASAGLSPEHFTVGYIGTLGMAHGLENVLAAAELSRGTPLRFLFVGAGAERSRLVAEAGRRGLDNVIFVPPQPKDRMPAWWSVCDVALVHLKDTPVFETVIPSKIFEAMAMGLPILLVAPAGEASRIVQGEDAGLWVRAGDPNALSQAAQLLHASWELRRDPARRSLAAAPRYSREKQARDMLDAIEAAALPAAARVASPDVAVGR
jgi:glycosyltransferase involved in cell wall biosynthesis